CPWRAGYDPLSPEVAGDPFALLAGARRDEPVFYLEKYDMWCVTRYEDAAVILRDWERFSSSPYGEAPAELPAEVAAAVGRGRDPGTRVLTPEVLRPPTPPRHRRMRRASQYAFPPKAVAKYEPDVRRTVTGLIDGFAADGETDLMARVGLPLPIMVIAD